MFNAKLGHYLPWAILAISDTHVNMTAVNVHDWSFCGRSYESRLVLRLRIEAKRFVSLLTPQNMLTSFLVSLLIASVISASGQKRR